MDKIHFLYRFILRNYAFLQTPFVCQPAHCYVTVLSSAPLYNSSILSFTVTESAHSKRQHSHYGPLVSKIKVQERAYLRKGEYAPYRQNRENHHGTYPIMNSFHPLRRVPADHRQINSSRQQQPHQDIPAI